MGLTFLRKKPPLIPEPGQKVRLHVGRGQWRGSFRAVSEPYTDETGEAVVRVAQEKEYQNAIREGRRAVSMPWPVRQIERISPLGDDERTQELPLRLREESERPPRGPVPEALRSAQRAARGGLGCSADGKLGRKQQEGGFMERPYIPPNLPTRVTVDNPAAGYWQTASGFYELIQERYKLLRRGLEEGQDLVLEYHTPAGEIIEINRIGLKGDTLIYQGHTPDAEECQILARASGSQVMFRVVTLPTEEPQRAPVGFR